MNLRGGVGGHVEEGPRENEGSGRQQERVTERSERRERRLPASGSEAWSDALENALFFTFLSPKKFKAGRDPSKPEQVACAVKYCLHLE